MKKIFHILTLISCIGISSCSTDLYDYDELNDRMDAFDKRLAELEDWCKETNTNINSLKALVESLLQHDVITSVTPVMNENVVLGYTITFLNADPITVYHGQDGKDGEDGKDGLDGADGEDGKDGADGQDGLNGYTPLIGIKQDTDGIYYWTLDGEWMTDAQGQKFKAQGEKGADGADGTDGEDGKDGTDGEDGTNGADGKDGVSPQLKIEENYWYISYDNGNTWQQLGKAIGADGKDGADGEPGKDGKDGESYFQSIDTSNADYVLFTFSDKTTLKIPTWAAFVALQTQCNQMNTNITSLQNIVTALQNNDYVTGVVPVTEDGAEIGYTITFSKSGSVTIYHGQDGADGHTPIIGVQQENGVYYWTIDSEWLLDEAGNKIKAQGEKGADGSSGSAGSNGADGKDGITPQLKIENGYWYVSYDNKETWTQLEKAVGEDGEDGKPGADGQPGTPGEDGEDGDSFFQSVDVTDTAVTFTLANGTTFTIPLGNPSVVSKITDVTYIPRYDDGKATAYYQDADSFEKDNAFVELDFTISPKSILSQLTEEMLSIKAVYTESRATITPVELEITSFEKDATTGNIALKVSCANLSDEFFSETVTASITLCIADAANEIYSAYIPLLAPEKKYRHVIYYTSTDGNTIDLDPLFEYKTNVKILSNTYENGQGMIALDGEITEFGDLQYETRLASIKIPEGVKIIGNSAFYGCSYLHTVELPESIESINNLAFWHCSSLKNINLPKNLKSIGMQAFIECVSLQDITIPSSVETIGESAFAYCSALIDLTLENGVASIGTTAFWNCTSLENVTIPGSVQTIGKEAFFDCTSLKSVTLMNGISVIDEKAFYWCSSLQTIEIPSSVVTLGSGCFMSCSVLKSVVLPKSLTIIETESFRFCYELTEIEIPASVVKISTNAFDATRALNKIICKPITPPTLGTNVFYEAYNKDLKIHVPTTALGTYTTKWAAYKDYIVDGGF